MEDNENQKPPAVVQMRFNLFQNIAAHLSKQNPEESSSSTSTKKERKADQGSSSSSEESSDDDSECDAGIAPPILFNAVPLTARITRSSLANAPKPSTTTVQPEPPCIEENAAGTEVDNNLEDKDAEISESELEDVAGSTTTTLDSSKDTETSVLNDSVVNTEDSSVDTDNLVESNDTHLSTGILKVSSGDPSVPWTKKSVTFNEAIETHQLPPSDIFSPNSSVDTVDEVEDTEGDYYSYTDEFEDSLDVDEDEVQENKESEEMVYEKTESISASSCPPPPPPPPPLPPPLFPSTPASPVISVPANLLSEIRQFPGFEQGNTVRGDKVGVGNNIHHETAANKSAPPSFLDEIRQFKGFKANVERKPKSVSNPVPEQKDLATILREKFKTMRLNIAGSEDIDNDNNISPTFQDSFDDTYM